MWKVLVGVLGLAIASATISVTPALAGTPTGTISASPSQSPGPAPTTATASPSPSPSPSVASSPAGSSPSPSPSPSPALPAGPAPTPTPVQAPRHQLYHPLSPFRLLDTRFGVGAPAAPVPSGQAITVTVAGVGGIPAGATSVVLNLTATNPTQAGYLTVYPAGGSMPVASNLNFTPGQTVPNLAVVRLGSGGALSIYNFAGQTDVIADVQGYFAPDTGTSGLFRPLLPSRIMDTRSGADGRIGALGSQETYNLTVAGRGSVPATGAGSVVINVTVTNPTQPGYLAVFPAGQGTPVASNLNFAAGQTVANRVIAKLGAGGAIGIYAFGGSVDVIVDVMGWFTDGTDAVAAGGEFVALAPSRVLDSRTGLGFAGRTLAYSRRGLTVSGGGGVPATGVSAVVLNLTATGGSAASFLTAYPGQNGLPLASDLNFQAGQAVPNLAIVQLGPDGTVNLYNYAGAVDIVADVSGYFTSAPQLGQPPGAPGPVQAQAGGSVGLAVTWGASSTPATTYAITAGSLTWAVAGPGTFTSPPIACNQTYSVSVVAVDAYGSSSAASAPATVTLPCPAAPLDGLRSLTAADITAATGIPEGSFGISVIAPDGSAWGINDEGMATAASTYKMPVLEVEAQLIAASPAAASDQLCFTAADYEDGPFNDYYEGWCSDRLSLMRRVGLHSDNTAAHILVRYLGGWAAVQAWIDSLGPNSDRLYDPNQATAHDLATIARGYEAMSPGAQAVASSVMTGSDFEAAIPAALTQGQVVIHKVGWYGIDTWDVALVRLPNQGDVAIAIWVSGGWEDFSSVHAIAARLSQAFQ